MTSRKDSAWLERPMPEGTESRSAPAATASFAWTVAASLKCTALTRMPSRDGRSRSQAMSVETSCGGVVGIMLRDYGHTEATWTINSGFSQLNDWVRSLARVDQVPLRVCNKLIAAAAHLFWICLDFRPALKRNKGSNLFGTALLREALCRSRVVQA